MEIITLPHLKRWGNICKATIPITEYMSRIKKVYDFTSTYLSGVYDYGEATEENIGKWILETVPSGEYIDVLFFEDEEESFVDFLYTTESGFSWSNDHEDFLQNGGGEMKTMIESMERVDNKINEMLDNLGSDNFNDGIPFVIEYNGEKVEIPFCPESVENMQLILKNLIEIFKEDYL